MSYRGKFSDAYALARDRYQQRKGVRLMELELRRFAIGDEGHLDCVAEDEFAVVDTATREKAFFEWPPKAEVLSITKMVEGHFGASAYRVGARLWLV